MRIPSVLAIALVAACVHHDNPDPRGLQAEAMARSGQGAWIVVSTDDADWEGELIAVEDQTLFLYGPRVHRLQRLDRRDVVSAEAYLYAISAGGEQLRVLSGVTTIAHGFWFVLSLPLSLGITAGLVNGERERAIISYPDQDWEELSKWSRFPQGLPPGIDVNALEHQVRRPPAPPPPPPPPIDAGPDAAPSPDAS